MLSDLNNALKNGSLISITLSNILVDVKYKNTDDKVIFSIKLFIITEINDITIDKIVSGKNHSNININIVDLIVTIDNVLIKLEYAIAYIIGMQQNIKLFLVTATEIPKKYQNYFYIIFLQYHNFFSYKKLHLTWLKY
ncbi:TPA: hypothetical protein ACGI6B_003597 [Clostridioides difficile]